MNIKCTEIDGAKKFSFLAPVGEKQVAIFQIWNNEKTPMKSTKPFSMRFRYPFFYILLFGLAFVVLGFLAVFMLLDRGELAVIAGLSGGALICLYAFYSTSQTILIDEQGVALDSLLGELRRFSWQEIAGIKVMGFFSPGMKVLNHNGENIEISSTLGRYDVILELIRRARADLWDKPQTGTARPVTTTTAATQAFDQEYRAVGWRWISVPIMLGISVFIAVLCFNAENRLYLLLAAFMLFVMFPGYLYSYYREPVLIATRGDRLFIRFRSRRLRKSIQVKVGDIQAICFNHQRTMGSHGAIHPSTEFAIHLPGKVKITVFGFDVSLEEMYLNLATWMEKHTADTKEE